MRPLNTIPVGQDSNVLGRVDVHLWELADVGGPRNILVVKHVRSFRLAPNHNKVTHGVSQLLIGLLGLVQLLAGLRYL